MQRATNKSKSGQVVFLDKGRRLYPGETANVTKATAKGLAKYDWVEVKDVKKPKAKPKPSGTGS